MLNYLNGIGATRHKKHVTPKRSAGKFKGALKKVTNVLPPVVAARAAKKLMQKSSPLNAIRIKKALKESRKRAVFQDAGEPLMIEQEIAPVETEIMEQADQEIRDGENEVMEQEFPDAEGTPDSETDGADMGVIFPDIQISGKAERKQRRQLKAEKKQAKTEKKKATAELRRARGQAKLIKAEKGGGSGQFLQQGLDIAKGFISKKQGGGDVTETTDSGTSQPTQESFFQKNKMLILGGGALLLLGGAFLLKRKK